MSSAVHHNPFEEPALAAAYDSWFETALGRTVDRLEKALIYRFAQPREGERALDVGTGTGHYACDLAGQGLHVIGLDSSEVMLHVARAKCQNVTWQHAAAETLPYPDGSFDLVLSVTALEFTHDPAKALSEMFRVVAPGGRLVLAVLNAASSWGRARQRETPFSRAHFYRPEEFAAVLATYGRPRWNSSVFIAPSGHGIEIADELEWLGQTFLRSYGALLVGRVGK